MSTLTKRILENPLPFFVRWGGFSLLIAGSILLLKSLLDKAISDKSANLTDPEASRKRKRKTNGRIKTGIILVIVSALVLLGGQIFFPGKDGNTITKLVGHFFPQKVQPEVDGENDPNEASNN